MNDFDSKRLRLRAYREAMEPIITAFSEQLARLPIRYIKDQDGTLTLDDTYPPERKDFMNQLRDISRTVYESLKVESFR